MSQKTISPVQPLHRLSHRRILLAEERERRMAAHFEERFGPEAAEAIQEIRAAHCPFLGPTRPEDVVDDEHLAGDGDPTRFFEEAARAQAVREAAVMAELLRRFGDAVEVEARLSAYDHGWEVGERVSGTRGITHVTPLEGFDLLADHFPWGTASNPGLHLLSSSDHEAVWQVFDSEVRELWENAGASPHMMCNLNAFWCKGFGEALRGEDGDGLDFRAGRSIADGEAYDECRFLSPEIEED